MITIIIITVIITTTITIIIIRRMIIIILPLLTASFLNSFPAVVLSHSKFSYHVHFQLMLTDW